MADANDLPTPLVSTDWLAAHLGADDLVVIDASWRMPGKGDAREDYVKRHIPGAVFFPIDEIADRATPLPHMLPSPEAFEEAVGALGICEKDRVVVYDDQGLFSAARVWWTLRAMGAQNVAVLDGGLPKWLAEGRAVSDAPPSPRAKCFSSSFAAHRVADSRRIKAAITSGAETVLDARPAGRFSGAEAEPRAGLRSGHMPCARSVPSGSLLGPDGRLKPREELRAIFDAAGVSVERPVITTCGSGVTAAIISLALETLGHGPHALYDGSWAEWGLEGNNPEDFPVEAGEA